MAGCVASCLAVLLGTAVGVATPASATTTTTLRFVQLHCIDGTNESGDDSPYFIVFVGEPDGSSTTMRIRDPAWDNAFDDNSTSNTSIAIRRDVSQGSLIVMMFLEEDGDPDISAATAAGNIATEMHNQWQFQLTSSPSGQAVAMTTTLFTSVFDRLGNDDWVDEEALRVTNTLISGISVPVALVGEGGEYTARFRMT